MRNRPIFSLHCLTACYRAYTAGMKNVNTVKANPNREKKTFSRV